MLTARMSATANLPSCARLGFELTISGGFWIISGSTWVFLFLGIWIKIFDIEVHKCPGLWRLS